MMRMEHEGGKAEVKGKSPEQITVGLRRNKKVALPDASGGKTVEKAPEDVTAGNDKHQQAEFFHLLFLFGADEFGQSANLAFGGNVGNAHFETQVGVLHIQNRQPFKKQFAVNDAVFDNFGQTETVKFGHFSRYLKTVCLLRELYDDSLLPTTIQFRYGLPSEARYFFTSQM